MAETIYYSNLDKNNKVNITNLVKKWKKKLSSQELLVWNIEKC